jgi:multidrug efflux pump
MYDKMPAIDSYFSVSGMYSASHAFQAIQLKPKSQRKESTMAMIGAISAQVNSFPGVMVNVMPPWPALAEFAGSDNGDNIGLTIMTTGDYLHLQQASQGLVDVLKNMPQFSRVDNKLKWDSEEFEINIDRNKAADLQVPISSVAGTISTLLASRTIGKANDANIMVQMKQSSLENPNIFSQLYVRNLVGEIIPLSQFSSVNTISAPEVFHRDMRLRSDTIYISLAPGVKLADAVALLTKAAKDTLPDDARFEFTGEAKSFIESSGAAALTFGLALLFIYLVLVAQFESFVDPLIILFTVPFAVIGSLLTLSLFSGTLNIYSNIGLITLIGLIAKHGILITEFANRMREEGMDIETAVINAAMLRLRPILMTTAAMVLGALPLALAYGPGAESRQQVGLVITGGLLFGTFFSLIVIPVMYTYLAPFKRVSTQPSDEGETHATVL